MSEGIAAPIAVVIVDRVEFKAALAKFAKIIPSKSNHGPRTGIRITAEETRVTLYGTNLDLSLQMCLDTENFGGGTGVAIADYKPLVAAMKAVKSDKVRLSVYDQSVIVEDTDSGIRIACPVVGGVDDYPLPPQLETFDEVLTPKFNTFSVPGAALAESMRYVLPGRSTDSFHYALNGVYMNSDTMGGIEFVTSDTHVLYMHRAPILSGNLLDNVGFLLLPGAVEWLAKHAGNVGEVHVQTDSNTVFFRGGNWSFATKQIEGMFPRYRDVMPDKAKMPGNLKVNRKALLDALKVASPHCNVETHRIDLLSANEGEALEVRAVRDGMTEFSTLIPAASRKCRPMIFNIDYLIDFLATYPGDAVTFRYDDDMKYDGPAAVYDDDKAFIVMPINRGRDEAEHKRMIEAYMTALAGPDQDFLGNAPVAALPTKHAPSFKTVVAYAKMNPEYREALLAALEV